MQLLEKSISHKWKDEDKRPKNESVHGTYKGQQGDQYGKTRE